VDQRQDSTQSQGRFQIDKLEERIAPSVAGTGGYEGQPGNQNSAGQNPSGSANPEGSANP
jgi:hypothetical protein